MVTPAVRGEAVVRLRSPFEVRERRGARCSGSIRCAIVAIGLTMRQCASMRAIRRRFGYRRLFVLMRREGLVMNQKRFRRLYREEQLQVRPGSYIAPRSLSWE
jgi:putative transposase